MVGWTPASANQMAPWGVANTEIERDPTLAAKAPGNPRFWPSLIKKKVQQKHTKNRKLKPTLVCIGIIVLPE